MKGLQATFLLILGCILCTQAIRHVHVYSIGFEESIVETAAAFYEVKEQVRMEESTEELLSEYESTSARIEELRKSESTEDQFSVRQKNLELFARNDALASELRLRESVTREIRDLWIFATAGLFLIGVGSTLYARGFDWAGMSLILPGFLELSWWSAPSFTLGGAVREYDVLLMNKIILTIIAFVLLYTLWFLAQRLRRRAVGKGS
ncbi:MAG: hypothetical protein OER91_11995 [Gammaproteobacteria bacterium]|nr:hypothetical protein [Gammaproteobacteria bacterium]